jgi:chemotaxis protein CheY-P-specific phosphatase CheC
MSQAASAVKDSTDQMKSSFSSAAAADQAVIQKVQQSTAAALDGFAKMKTGGIFAFDAVRAKMIEATAEVGRLRAQILETNDAATPRTPEQRTSNCHCGDECGSHGDACAGIRSAGDHRKGQPTR